MKISVHTVVRDGIRLDFHIEAMLRHHAKYADEVVVLEGYSDDDTYERISGIADNIKIYREPWKATDSYTDYVNRGLQYCTGDWAVKLDADEFIPEWVWPSLREHIATTDSLITGVQLVNFYANYRVYHADPDKISWPHFKWCIHRNTGEYIFWGDGSNAQLAEHEKSYGRSDVAFETHHFGAVRDSARLREKWRTQAARNQKHVGKYKDRKRIRSLPKFIFNLFPHKWLDEDLLDDLKIYEGEVMQCVQDDPHEFVRDDMKVYEFLRKQLVNQV